MQVGGLSAGLAGRHGCLVATESAKATQLECSRTNALIRRLVR